MSEIETGNRVFGKQSLPGNSVAFAHVSALVGYFIATLLFTWPLAGSLTTAIPGDGFDGWQNYWNQWWIKLALLDRLIWPLHTDILYAPTGVNLYFHTLNPFNGLATLPIQLVGGLIPAYNAVVFLSWVLAGYGMFLLARWVIGTAYVPGTGERKRSLEVPGTLGAPVAAFLAGLVYTLSPFHMAHLLGHMQVMSLQWVPFYVLYLLRAISQSQAASATNTANRSWLRSGLLAGLFLVFNGLCDWYFVLYLLLFTGFAVAWQWVVGLRRRNVDVGTAARRAAFSLRALWATIRPALVAAVVFVVLLSFWLVPMIQEVRQFRFMVRPPADLYILSASVMDFFVPNRLHTLFRPGSFTWIGNQIAPVSERTISIGYVALAFALAAAVMARRKAAATWGQVAFWWVGALLFLVLALGPQWHWGNITWESMPPAVSAGQEIPSWTPYTLLNQLVPFMRISRSVSRFALMVQLCMAVLAAIGLHAMLTWAAVRGRTRVAAYALAGVAIVVVIAEYWVAPYPLSPPDTPAYYEQLATDGDARSVLNLPMNYDRPGYLLYQTVHGKPLTVAYISRDDPRTLTERAPVLQHFRHLGDDIIDVDPAALASTVFADLGIGTVILDRYKMPGGLEREYTEALAGRIFAGQEPVYADDRITAYRVADRTTSPTPSQPYIQLGPSNWGPRQVDDSGQARRALSGGPATIEFQHATTPMQVTIRYRTEGADASANVLSLDGSALLAELPAAPGGGEVTIDLPPATGGMGLALEPSPAGTVYVEQIRLD